MNGCQFILSTFWGCPSLWSGRAVRGLAGLLGPSQKIALLILLGLAFGHPLPSLSQIELRCFGHGLLQILC